MFLISKPHFFSNDTNLRLSHTNIQQLQIEVSREINKVNDWMKKKN